MARRIARGTPIRPALFPQEQTQLVDRVAWARRGYLGWLGGALIMFASSGAIMVLGAGSGSGARAPDRSDTATIATAIGTALDASVVAGRARAEQLAADTKVRAAILTDVATVADMVRSEFEFKPHEGETIELVQVHGDTTLTLMRLPAGAPPIAPVRGTEATLVSHDGTSIDVVVAAPVIPYRAEHQGDGGALALSTRVNLQHMQQRLEKVTSGASLAIAGSELVLRPNSEAVEAGGMTVSVPVPTSEASRLPTMTLNIVVAGAGNPWSSKIVYATWVMGALLLGAFAVAVRRRRMTRPGFRVVLRAPVGAPVMRPAMRQMTEPLPEPAVRPASRPETKPPRPLTPPPIVVRSPPKTMRIPPKQKSDE